MDPASPFTSGSSTEGSAPWNRTEPKSKTALPLPRPRPRAGQQTPDAVSQSVSYIYNIIYLQPGIVIASDTGSDRSPIAGRGFIVFEPVRWMNQKRGKSTLDG